MQQSRRTSRPSRSRQHSDHRLANSSSGDSSDSSLSRILIHSAEQTSAHTLPIRIEPAVASSFMTTTRRTIDTQTSQEFISPSTFASKSVPSFAETQLLSVYYLNRNITNQPAGKTNPDTCIFTEQQNRQPIRFRAAYDPSASSKATQTSPPSSFISNNRLSTHGSTLIVDGHQEIIGTNRLYEQRVKIHSGSQRLSNSPLLSTDNDEFLSPSELVEESRYSYEEYIIHVDNNQADTLTKQTSSSSPTSTSSVTTIIAQQPSPPVPPFRPSSQPETRPMLQPGELDSDRTSHLSGDEATTHSSASSMSGSFTNQDWPGNTNTAVAAANASTKRSPSTTTTTTTTRISSWPPAPSEALPTDSQFETSFILDESEEQQRPTRVQFSEQLVHVIPASNTNSISDGSATPPSAPRPAPAVVPRTSNNRGSSWESGEQQLRVDMEEDETSTTTTTSSAQEQPPGRLQRAGGVTNLNEVMMSRPTAAPPPPPPPPQPPSSGVDPRQVRDQLQRLDYRLVVDTRHPINQSKWVKDHLDVQDVPITASSAGRVEALRTLFEQQSGRSSDSSTLNSPPGQTRRIEPEERPSRQGDEVRFRINQSTTTTSSVHHAEPAKVIERSQPSTQVTPMTWEDLLGVQIEHDYQRRQQTSSPFEIDEIRFITGNQRLQNLNDVGYYLSDGYTWKWDEKFWSNLTASQREQLKRLQQQNSISSRSRNDSGDTQIDEKSDRIAYQGDYEDNTPRIEKNARRGPTSSSSRSRDSSQENISSSVIVLNPSDNVKRSKLTPTMDPGSTVSVTGAGAWQQQQQQTSTGIAKYTETATIHESKPTVSIFGSAPGQSTGATYSRLGPQQTGSQESIASSIAQQQQQQAAAAATKRSDSQMTIIESGYSSADEAQQQQQRSGPFRPGSSTIIEEPSPAHHLEPSGGVAVLIAGPSSMIIPSDNMRLRESPIYENLRPDARQQQQQLVEEPELDPLSYEHFICEYLSTHARRQRAGDSSLILLVDGQQIHMSHIRLPSNDTLILSNNVYLDAIDEYPPPFETESDQLIVFIQGEPLVLPADRWAVYRKKYARADWIHRLDRVNRHVPTEVAQVVQYWLAEHSTFTTDELIVDGLHVPLVGRLGSRLLDLHQTQQLDSNSEHHWAEVLKYLIRTGYVSFDNERKCVRVANSELDARRLLQPTPPSTELIERLANLLRTLDNIQFNNNDGTLIIDETFVIPHEYVRELFERHERGETLNAQELAIHLLRLCEVDDDGQALILTFNGQSLTLSPSSVEEPPIVINTDERLLQWIADNVQWSSEQGRFFLLRYTSMPQHLVRIEGQDGLRLSNLLHRQAFQLDDLLRWHRANARIDTNQDSIRMTIQPTSNIKIIDLGSSSSVENERERKKSTDVNEEKSTEKKKSSNQQRQPLPPSSQTGEGSRVGEKNLLFFIPLHSQQHSDNDDEVEREKEEEYPSQHTSAAEEEIVVVEEEEGGEKEQNKIENEKRALLLQSITSLLHTVNANGGSGTLELIQGRRLRLSLTSLSFSTPQQQQQQQHIEFDENDTKLLCQDLELDIDACSHYLLDHILDSVEINEQEQILTITYHNQMLKFKNFKQKFLQPTAKKLRLTLNSGNKTPSSSIPIDENQVQLLTQWLDQLNRQQLITITEQNDIVILAGGEQDLEQQIFVNHEDVDIYMETKANANKGISPEEAEIIGMPDIARILLRFGYVDGSSGQLTFGEQRIALDSNELTWLISIVRGVRPDAQNRETQVDLFDGENTQLLRIPYEYMPPTNQIRTVAEYLFRNGHVRYDVETGSYAYRYVEPDIPLDDNGTESPEQVGQRQLLLSHIRQVHVDEQQELVELEFLHESAHRLVLPSRWYRQALAHRFDRTYIIDMLLANGGVIDRDTFVFNGRAYSLQVPRVTTTTTIGTSSANLQTVKLSSKQKTELIRRYIELIIEQDGMKQDDTTQLLLVENRADGSQLYFTPEHSEIIRQNQFRRQDVIRLLVKHGQIKQDEFGNSLLYYNDQYVQLPGELMTSSSSNSQPQNMANVIRSLGERFGTANRQTSRPITTTTTTIENDDAQFRARLAQETQPDFLARYHDTIDYMCRHDLVTWDKRLKLIRLHFVNQTLILPLDQLRPIIDQRIISSSAAVDGVLPFGSRQLSQWLLGNSDTIRNTRQGHIELIHRNHQYELPLINTFRRSQSTLGAIVKRFGLTSKSASTLAKIDLNTPEMQIRCAHHLLEQLDQFGGVNIDNDTRTLILSMTPDNQQQLIIRNPNLPITKQTLTDYLLTHGRFVLNADRTDIDYRHLDDGRIYRFGAYIHNWHEALGETNEQRIVRVLGEILVLNGRFLQRADRQIIISLRNGDRFVIPQNIGAQLMGPVNGQTIAELLFKYADDIHEEQDGKILVIQLGNQILRLQQERQLMSSKQSTLQQSKSNNTGATTDPRLKLLFPFNKALRQIQKTPSTSTLAIQPPDASNGYAIDPLLMLANYIYRAASIYQDDLGRLVIKMNEDEIVVPRIEAINAIETINTSPHRTGTIVARLIDRIGKVQSNKAGGLIITIGKSSFELPKELIDRANQLHRETMDIEHDLIVQDQESIQSGLNGSMTLAGRHNRMAGASTLLPLLRHSKSVGSLSTSTIGHPWFTDDQQMLYTKDGRGDARYLNLDNYALAWQNEPHKHGINCEVRTLRNVAPYLNIMGYVENDPKKAITINDLARLHPEMLTKGKYTDNLYLTQLENDRARVQTSLCPRPRILVIPDDETMLASNRQTRFYVQYMYENDAVLGTDPAYVMMLPSRYPVTPTRPQLIAPYHYRDISLREAPVYVHKKGEGQAYFENLAQYLSADHPDISPRTVRRMLRFSSRDDYLAYLSNKMPAADAEQLVEQSEEPPGEPPERYVNVKTTSGSRTLTENDDEEDDDLDDEVIENDTRRQPAQPRRSVQTTNGSGGTTTDKTVTLPRSATLSGQSVDGESESRTTVSRSVSAAAAKVVNSKSDTMKSTTSSSAASSREQPAAGSSSVARASSLVSPTRTSGSKGPDDSKKEKKSKFRTPSFLKKRKEKKEAKEAAAAAAKDKA